MRGYLMVTAAAAMAVAVQTAAQAGTYIPVPMVPGAVSEISFAINNKNIVAGSFKDSAGVEHGFFGPLDGSDWTTFDAPFEGTTGTQARSINDDGAIVGIALNPAFTVGVEFYRKPDGTFSVFEKDGQPLDGIAQGLNPSGVSVGDYINADGKTVGYTGQSGSYTADFKLHLKGNKNFARVSLRGIDNLAQDFVGSFTDQLGNRHGFVQSHVQKDPYLVHVIDYPNAQGTALEGINSKGEFSGQWTDTSGNAHAFLVQYHKRGGETIDLDPLDGSTFQEAWGINDHEFVALNTNVRAYIYCPRHHSEKCPKGIEATDRRPALRVP